MQERTYVVTRVPQTDGQHFLHRSDCQVLPDDLELEELGGFEDCEAVMPKARQLFDPVNGCALCCPECHA
jgi:hypothetical protein